MIAGCNRADPHHPSRAESGPGRRRPENHLCCSNVCEREREREKSTLADERVARWPAAIRVRVSSTHLQLCLCLSLNE